MADIYIRQSGGAEQVGDPEVFGTVGKALDAVFGCADDMGQVIKTVGQGRLKNRDIGVTAPKNGAVVYL